MRLSDFFSNIALYPLMGGAVNGTTFAIELSLNCIELILTKGRQINALWQVLPNQTVYALTITPLPRTMWVREAHLHNTADARPFDKVTLPMNSKHLASGGRI